MYAVLTFYTVVCLCAYVKIISFKLLRRRFKTTHSSLLHSNKYEVSFTFWIMGGLL